MVCYLLYLIDVVEPGKDTPYKDPTGMGKIVREIVSFVTITKSAIDSILFGMVYRFHRVTHIPLRSKIVLDNLDLSSLQTGQEGDIRR
jgi:hypothetical protein